MARLRRLELNYELLGNSCPHLHWFLIPRYDTDPHPRSRLGGPELPPLALDRRGRLPPAERDEMRLPRWATAADVEIEASFVRSRIAAVHSFQHEREDSCPTPTGHAEMCVVLRVAGTNAKVSACAVGPCSKRCSRRDFDSSAFGRWPSGTTTARDEPRGSRTFMSVPERLPMTTRVRERTKRRDRAPDRHRGEHVGTERVGVVEDAVLLAPHEPIRRLGLCQ